MEIRELEPQDLDELRMLVQQVYSDSKLAMWFERAPSDEDLNEIFRLKMIAISGKSAVDLVAIDGGKIVGECEIVSTGVSYLVGIIVAEQSRRRGIGKELLLRGIVAARKLKWPNISVEVAEDNAPARNFFLKNGFVQLGVADRQFTKDKKSHRILYMVNEL